MIDHTTSRVLSIMPTKKAPTQADDTFRFLNQCRYLYSNSLDLMYSTLWSTVLDHTSYVESQSCTVLTLQPSTPTHRAPSTQRSLHHGLPDAAILLVSSVPHILRLFVTIMSAPKSFSFIASPLPLRPHPLFPHSSLVANTITTPTPKRFVVKSVSSRPSASDPFDDPSSNSSSAQQLLRALSQPLSQNPDFDYLDDEDDYDDERPTEIGEKVFESQGSIDFFYHYIRTGLNEDVNKFLSSPLRLLPTAAGAVLFGFFAATSATTIIGSVADWDPLAAAVLLILTEGFAKYYYLKPRTSKLLQLVNAFRIGLVYGMVVDSFKLCT